MLPRLLFDEIRYRKLNFAASLLAVAVAVALVVAAPLVVEGHRNATDAYLAEKHAQLDGELSRIEQETDAELAKMEDDARKIMRDLGFNLLIVHRDTNMSDFWSKGYAAVDMPQEYVDRLAGDATLTLVTHLVATIQQKVTWTDPNGSERTVLLVGYLPETVQSHQQHQSAMGYTIEPGDVYVGHELAGGIGAGDQIDILGTKFRVAQILPEKGSTEDIMLAMRLGDVQTLLDKPGKVNQILALGCRCAGERLPKIRAQLAAALPETKITEFRSIAVGRAEQRDAVRATHLAMLATTAADHEKILAEERAGRDEVQSRMEGLAAVVTPVGVLVCAVWVGLLVFANVRERRMEIGLLRALGKGSASIAALFLTKAVLLGLLGGVIGFGCGAIAAREVGGLLGITSGQLPASVGLLPWAVLGAPVICALAAYLPTLSAIVQDPAIVLRDS